MSSRRFFLLVAFVALMVPRCSFAQFPDSSTITLRPPTSASLIPAFHPHAPTSILDTSIPVAKVDDEGVSWLRTGVVVGGIASVFTILHIYQSNAWWKDNRTAFHVIEDADYQADFDKFGHAFGGYYTSVFFDASYRWAGMDSARASLMGALSGALYEFYVEMEDGFAGGWGFSRGDAKADLAGATFYLLNQRVPFLRNFRYKWLYTPTNKLLDNHPDVASPGHDVNFIEDYGGQTYYLSANIHGFLPESLQPYWPRWLNVAAAVSGYNINYPDFARRHKAWYLALDYDLDRMIPETPWGFLNLVIKGLGYWHLPAPAWRFYPNSEFFWTFPLSITFDHGIHLGAEPSFGRTE
jgi:hypothetical protein